MGLRRLWRGWANRAAGAVVLSVLPPVVLAMLLCAGCQAATPRSGPAAPAAMAGTSQAEPIPSVTPMPSQTPIPELPTLATSPSPQAEPTPSVTPMPSQTPTTPTVATSPSPQPMTPAAMPWAKLPGESAGRFVSCTDEVLGIEFEYPATWGEVGTHLGAGNTGYSYYYFFSNFYPPPATRLEYPMAGGRSRDYTAGRGGSLLGFRGFEDGTYPDGDGCARLRSTNRRDLWPICREIRPGLVWAIEFQYASHFCGEIPGNLLPVASYQPVVVILLDLPSNSTINGFVFEAPFLSQDLSKQLDSELLPLLMLGDIREQCIHTADLEEFNRRVQAFVERVRARSLDAETLQNLDDLMHLATSISFTEGPGG